MKQQKHSPDELMRMAHEARKHAYAPYSGFSVGAALLCADGTVFCGANIENSAFSPTICAERCAISHAVYAGFRSFSAIAVSGGKTEASGAFCPPCGVCRQVLSEFCPPDMPIYLETEDGIKAYTLAELLPFGFGAEEMK